MKRLVPALILALMAGLFIWLFVNRQSLSDSGAARQQPRTVIPASNVSQSTTAESGDSAASYDESKIQPLIPLQNDETFLQAITGDLNRDGIPDQICAVKNVTDSAVYLIPALQNPLTGEYVRGTSIKTGVTQSRTLLFYIIDVIGDHSDSLVYTGMTGDNMQLLSVYAPTVSIDGKIQYHAIADLRSDGPITIRELGRYEAYDLGITSGESFPIITYSSDPDSPQTLDQIERTYQWDKALKRYRMVSEKRITGKKIENTLIQQLQGGDINSFKSFLSGLWYRTGGTGTGAALYLFYDLADDEFIFHNGLTEEVYQIDTVVSRRYGVYLTTRNKSISSIRRLIDVELSATDEIRIKVQEDVKLKIGVASDWDGVYRKMSSPQGAARTGKVSTQNIRERIDSAPLWKTTDGLTLSLNQAGYSLTGPAQSERGAWALLEVQDAPVLQLKTQGGDIRFYRILLTSAGFSIEQVTVSMQGTGATGEPLHSFVPSL